MCFADSARRKLRYRLPGGSVRKRGRFDAVGGDTLRRSWGVLKPSGRLVTIVSDGETTGDERVKAAFFIVEPKREQLIEIGRLLDAGDLQVVVDSLVPFSGAPEAYAERVERKGRGELVVELRSSTHTGVVEALRRNEFLKTSPEGAGLANA